MKTRINYQKSWIFLLFKSGKIHTYYWQENLSGVWINTSVSVDLCLFPDNNLGIAKTYFMLIELWNDDTIMFQLVYHTHLYKVFSYNNLAVWRGKRKRQMPFTFEGRGTFKCMFERNICSNWESLTSKYLHDLLANCYYFWVQSRFIFLSRLTWICINVFLLEHSLSPSADQWLLLISGVLHKSMSISDIILTSG